jgi:hypothetical protein
MNKRRRANLLFYQERAFGQTLPVAVAFAAKSAFLLFASLFVWVSAATRTRRISLALASRQNTAAQKAS